MKKILFLLLIIIGTAVSCFSQNLALTATVVATSTNASYPVSNVNDGNSSTKWQSSAGGTQNLTFTLTKTIRFATVTITNLNATDGFTVQLSPDNSTWTTVASYSGSVSSFIKSNLYLVSSNQFVLYNYIRIQMGANEGTASVYEVAITEDPTLFASFTGSQANSSYPLINAVDGNTSTAFSNYYMSNTSISLNIRLCRNTIKAMNVNVNSDTKGLRVDVTDINGRTTSGYYYTLKANDNFLVVNPTGILSITVASDNTSTVYINEVTLSEVSIGSVSLNYTYDAAGNMNNRTILLITANKTIVTPGDTIIPMELTDSARLATPPLTDEIAGKKLYIFPNPTRGELKVNMNNLTQNDNLAIEIFTVSGVKVLEKQNCTSENILNVSNFSNGTYVMLVTLNGTVQKWTIIKQ